MAWVKKRFPPDSLILENTDFMVTPAWQSFFINLFYGIMLGN
jgi:hypothetical protein